MVAVLEIVTPAAVPVALATPAAPTTSAAMASALAIRVCMCLNIDLLLAVLRTQHLMRVLRASSFGGGTLSNSLHARVELHRARLTRGEGFFELPADVRQLRGQVGASHAVLGLHRELLHG